MAQVPRTYLVLTFLLAAFYETSCTASKPFHQTEQKNRAPATEQLAFQNDRYLRDIHPIFSNRCVVCHTCVDAPCQLHLDTYNGVRRGATVSNMGTSLFETPPTRDKDAKTVDEWRTKGFFAIIRDLKKEEQPQPTSTHLQESILYQLVEQGFQHNQPGFDLDALDEHRENNYRCVATPQLAKKFRERYPAAGMPYGLPGLDPLAFETLTGWIADGAPGPSEDAFREITQPSHPEMIDEWEKFLNDSLKARLSARFIYEHSFMAHIHFEGTPDTEFFELVRSKTPFPEPVDEIVTQRPYDSPGTDPNGHLIPFYYRFKKVTQTIVRKTHILWELGPSQLLSLRTLFLETPWNPEGDSNLIDPGYRSTNPFEYFRQIPAEIRYRFMIQNSRLIVNSMIRGPVCSGRIATDAIRDHFWVFFLDPAADVTVREPTIGLYEWAPLGAKLPSNLPPASKNYNRAMHQYKPEGFTLDDIWKGEGTYRDAMLTILRHETSATVHYGPQGGQPGTVWVLNFSNFERIYYNLVVDFKPWGNDLHKLATWTSMSSHRAEAEERFISFLPKKYRSEIRSQWTSGLGGVFENHSKKKYSDGVQSLIEVDQKFPFQSLLEQIVDQMSPTVLGTMDMLAEFPKSTFNIPNEIRHVEDWERALSALSLKAHFKFPEFLPEILFIRLENQPYTLISHRAYAFNNLVTLHQLAYEPEKDTIAAFRGLYGDRPELFIELSMEQTGKFLKDLTSIKNEKHWENFKKTYAIRRNNPHFWELLDWFHDWDRKSSSLEAGVFDVSQYDIDQ